MDKMAQIESAKSPESVAISGSDHDHFMERVSSPVNWLAGP
jgi:hypothetical protein